MAGGGTGGQSPGSQHGDPGPGQAGYAEAQGFSELGLHVRKLAEVDSGGQRCVLTRQCADMLGPERQHTPALGPRAESSWGLSVQASA